MAQRPALRRNGGCKKIVGRSITVCLSCASTLRVNRMRASEYLFNPEKWKTNKTRLEHCTCLREKLYRWCLQASSSSLLHEWKITVVTVKLGFDLSELYATKNLSYNLETKHFREQEKLLRSKPRKEKEWNLNCLKSITSQNSGKV